MLDDNDFIKFVSPRTALSFPFFPSFPKFQISVLGFVQCSKDENFENVFF